MAGYERAFFNTHREWFLVSFQDLELKVVGKAFAIFFPIMGTHEVLIESRFLPNLCSFAVELRYMLFRSAVAVLA